MSQRYIPFDMNELSRIAAEAVGSESCSKVEKYPDGMFNKTFLFTMNDGTQVVGKVPNPNAGRPHFTTASEVATMDFVRNMFRTPAPKVYAWSSNAENPVGAEYIIMEKVAGIQLDRVWPTMDIKDRFAVVKAIAGYQNSWLSTSFPHIGALYYAQDIRNCRSLGCVYTNHDGVEVNDSRFLVGPCTGREFIDDGRASVVFDRGPWSSVEDYKTAIGHREITCVRNLSQLPKSPLTLCGPGTYRPSREKKIAALENYLKLVKYLLPTDDSITGSSLWHSDLHRENIYVNPDKPGEIVGIIDWQSTDLLPLFDHARQPYILDYDGPHVTGLERPALPENFQELTSEEQRRAQSLYLQMSLLALYKKLTHDRNERLYGAMEFRETLSFELLLLAQNLLIDGEAHYQAHIVNLEHVWADLPGVRAHGNPPFPCHFSSDKLTAIYDDEARAIRGMEYMELIKQTLGDLWPEKGIVRHDQYNESKEALRQAKLRLFDQLGLNEHERIDWDLAWPFDD